MLGVLTPKMVDLELQKHVLRHNFYKSAHSPRSKSVIISFLHTYLPSRNMFKYYASFHFSNFHQNYKPVSTVRINH